MPSTASSSMETLDGRSEYVALLAGAPAQKRDIVDAVDAARSTVDRDVRALCDAGLVERTADGYRTTAAGRLSLNIHSRHQCALDDVADATSVLERLPAYAPLSTEFVVGADVIEPTTVSPDRPLADLVDVLEDATAVRAASPVVLQRFLTDAEERVPTNAPVELVLAESVVEYLIANHAGALGRALEDDTTTVYERESVPYGIVLASTDDGHCGTVVVCDDGGVCGLLRNDDPDAVRWLEDQYGRLRASSTRRE